MNIKFRKVGNSDGVLIPQEVMKHYGLKTGDEAELILEEGRMVFKIVKSDLSEQLAAARIGMQKYRVALNELAK